MKWFSGELTVKLIANQKWAQFKWTSPIIWLLSSEKIFQSYKFVAWYTVIVKLLFNIFNLNLCFMKVSFVDRVIRYAKSTLCIYKLRPQIECSIKPNSVVWGRWTLNYLKKFLKAIVCWSLNMDCTVIVCFFYN